MNPNIKKALKSLEEADLATFFEEIDKVNLPKSLMPNYAKFKREFMHGNASFEFTDRLRVFVNSLDDKTENSEIIEKPKNTETISDSRKARKIKRIEKNIEETEQLLDAWESKKRIAENPNEKMRAEKEIEKLENILEEYEQDLAKLG